MMDFYIQAGDSKWEYTGAATLRGAKGVAARRYQSGFTGELMQVATGDGQKVQRHVLSTKYNMVKAVWHDII